MANDNNYGAGGGKRDSAVECHQLCRAMPKCKFFSYKTGGSKECWLKTASSGRRKDNKTISGPRNCENGKFIKTFFHLHC